MPVVHRCGARGCRAMIPLGYRYCEQHYNEYVSGLQHKQATRQATTAYQYHKQRKAKYYDEHHRFNSDDLDNSDQQRSNLYKSFGIKEPTKKPAKTMAQSERAKFYRSKRWHNVRDDITAKAMNICAICGQSKHLMYVDHVVPLYLCDDNQQYAESNLWVLCGGCHNHKTRIEKKTNDDKLKRMTKSDWHKRLSKQNTPALSSQGFPYTIPSSHKNV